jgi:cytochrome P450
VYFDEQLEAHLVLSFEHATTVMKDPVTFSSDPRKSPKWDKKLDTTGDIWAKVLAFEDSPLHVRHRRAVNDFFTPRSIEKLRHRVVSIVDTALEPVADGQPVDIVKDVAGPISLGVICEMFDVGTEGAQILKEEGPRLITILEPDPNDETREEVNSAGMTLMMFLVPLIAERRIVPGDDIISALIHQPEGDPVDVDDIVMLSISMLPAGFITTTGMIGLGLVALLENPDQFRWLRDNPDKSEQALEELLRYDGPVQVALRVATRDWELGGQKVRKGDHLVVGLSAANRDPARFDNPERLDLTRAGPPHLGFGHGPHYCLGHALGRMESAQTFHRLGQWADRLLEEDWSYQRGKEITFRGLDYLRLGGTSAAHKPDPVPIAR